MVKLKKIWPDFQFDLRGDSERENHEIFHSIVSPNIENFDFIFTKGINPKDYKVTFMGLGRKIAPGSGVDLDKNSLKYLVRNSIPHQDMRPLVYNETKAIFAEYAFYYLKAGLMANTPDDAIKYFEEALKIVPYCIPAQQNICHLQKKMGQDATGCLRKLEMLTLTELNYF
jgi:hypothetical protein